MTLLGEILVAEETFRIRQDHALNTPACCYVRHADNGRTLRLHRLRVGIASQRGKLSTAWVWRGWLWDTRRWYGTQVDVDDAWTRCGRGVQVYEQEVTV
jgi:hypothetical protein